jgi:hypothetical protein
MDVFAKSRAKLWEETLYIRFCLGCERIVTELAYSEFRILRHDWCDSKSLCGVLVWRVARAI